MIIDTTYDVKNYIGQISLRHNFIILQVHILTFYQKNVFHQHDMIKGGLQSVILKAMEQI